MFVKEQRDIFGFLIDPGTAMVCLALDLWAPYWADLGLPSQALMAAARGMRDRIAHEKTWRLDSMNRSEVGWKQMMDALKEVPDHERQIDEAWLTSCCNDINFYGGIDFVWSLGLTDAYTGRLSNDGLPEFSQRIQELKLALLDQDDVELPEPSGWDNIIWDVPQPDDPFDFELKLNLDITTFNTKFLWTLVAGDAPLSEWQKLIDWGKDKGRPHLRAIDDPETLRTALTLPAPLFDFHYRKAEDILSRS